MLRATILASVVLFSAAFCTAQAKTNVYKVTSPIQSLNTQLGATIDDNTEPYKSGDLTPNTKDVVALLNALGADPKKTTIIHLLRWNDSPHTNVMFQKWYLYDPTPSKTSFYLETQKQIFQQTAIAGRTDLQFIYIHLNFNLAANEAEWRSTPTVADPTPGLAHPINYTITVTKQQSQFIQDVQSLLQILKVVTPMAAAAATPAPGYFSVTTFHSCSDALCSQQWPTSTITIAASLDSSNKIQSATATKDAKGNATSASGQLSSNTFHNEKPSWVGLSAGIPIKSYKDVTYQQSSGTLVPSTATQQNAYVFVDGYLPPVLPTLTAFRYIPHPFFGLPLKGKVFRHTMVGVGIGLHWVEPFGGLIFDTQNNQVTGPASTSSHVTYKGVFGVKMSISSLVTALKAKTK
jgi:hypothetical protein